jgi:hypothetical protein
MPSVLIITNVSPGAIYTTLKRKSKDWLSRNHDNVSELGDMSTSRLLFQCASTIQIQQRVLFWYKVFGLTRSGLKPTIYHNRGEYANHYIMDVVSTCIVYKQCDIRKLVFTFNIVHVQHGFIECYRNGSRFVSTSADWVSGDLLYLRQWLAYSPLLW